MDWTAAVDIYCERTSAAFWAEPLNAISNLAFVVAGASAAWAARRASRLDLLLGWLCFLAVSIGVGSFLFHTFAQRWAGFADVIPILLFIVSYLAAAASRLFGLRWIFAIPATIAAFAVALLARSAVLWIAGGSINGSEGYAPAFALIAGSALLLWFRKHPSAPMIAAAAAVFLVSLVTRTIDPLVCAAAPFGTHFLWHLLNGTMIGILLFAMLRHGHKPR